MVREPRREERPGLYCVELRTQNWERLVNWYREVLGLRVLVRVIDDGYALLEAGDTRIALVSRPKVDPPSARISLAFEVTDVKQLCDKLVAFGSTVTFPDRTFPMSAVRRSSSTCRSGQTTAMERTLVTAAATESGAISGRLVSLSIAITSFSARICHSSQRPVNSETCLSLAAL